MYAESTLFTEIFGFQVGLEILDAAVSIGIVEQYDEDFALSRAAHLLCQYDEDLADSSWQRLTDLASQTVSRDVHDDQLHLNHLAATQWIHTSSAMEAAEVLDFGGDSSSEPLEILDLGCGSAVWTCDGLPRSNRKDYRCRS